MNVNISFGYQTAGIPVSASIEKKNSHSEIHEYGSGTLHIASPI
jgi:hypothetical protein